MDNRDLARRVGAAMAARRKGRGYTRAQLAERLCLSQEALSRMEKGLISPKFSRLQDIADALDCTVAELFRAPSDSAQARGMAVAELIYPLSPEGQEAIVDLVGHLVRAFLPRYRAERKPETETPRKPPPAPG